MNGWKLLLAVDPVEIGSKIAEAAQSKTDRQLFIWAIVFVFMVLILVIMRLEWYYQRQGKKIDEQAKLQRDEDSARLKEANEVMRKMIETQANATAMLDRCERQLDQNWEVMKDRMKK